MCCQVDQGDQIRAAKNEGGLAVLAEFNAGNAVGVFQTFEFLTSFQRVNVDYPQTRIRIDQKFSVRGDRDKLYVAIVRTADREN